MSLVAVLILLATHTAPATAQQKAQTVSGTVLDPDGNPLIGATVVVVKGTQGAVTDVKGKFTIKAKPSDSLQISYLGYKTETLNVGSRTNFTVRMEKDSSTDIDEIVVIGYGQVAKKDLTGSVATVKMNDIKDVPVLSVDNALQGRIAGADFPHEVVRSRFLKLDSSHIEFVMESLHNNTTEIRNMKQYLLTVLFNAPTTMSNHYTAQVNHDMYAGGW